MSLIIGRTVAAELAIEENQGRYNAVSVVGFDESGCYCKQTSYWA